MLRMKEKMVHINTLLHYFTQLLKIQINLEIIIQILQPINVEFNSMH